MKCKPPYRFFLSLLLIAATPCLAGQQPAQGQAAQSSPSQTGGAAPAALSPKEMQEEKAKVQIAEKRYEAAIQTYQDLLKSDPKNAIYMNMIGIAYLDLANFDQAKKY